jgi:hypothetical protein
MSVSVNRVILTACRSLPATPISGHIQSRLACRFGAIPEVAPPFDQRAGVRPGLGVKLGSGRQGQVEFAMRRLVKTQPEHTRDFTGRFKSKNWEPQPNQFYLIPIVILSETSGGLNG